MRGFRLFRAMRRHRIATGGVLFCVAVLTGPSLASAERAGSSVRTLQAGTLDAGEFSTCAVGDDGSAWCWGSDVSGALGDGAPIADQSAPVRVLLPDGRLARSISAGRNYACVVVDDGSAWCWGNDSSENLGDGPGSVNQPAPVRVQLPAGRRAVAITAGAFHTCALLDDRSVWCWGSDSAGQIGNGGLNQDSGVPSKARLPPEPGAVAVAAGGAHTCAILVDETTWCWGLGGGGALGDGTAQDRSTPVQVVAGMGFLHTTAISAGAASTCAIASDARTACWGGDTDGQLGDDTSLTGKAAPVLVGGPVSPLAGGTAISAGGRHACWTAPSSTQCWGDDFHGQLGDGPPGQDMPIPQVVLGIPATRQVVAITTEGAGNFPTAGGHSCAAYDDGSVTCWGDDLYGQLGNGAGVTGSLTRPDEGPAALPAGSVFGLAADLSVSLEGAPAGLRVGESGQIVVRLRNFGPDSVSDVRVALTTASLALGSAVATQGTVTGATWNAGAVPAGGEVTLTVAVTAVSAPSGSLTAEVVAMGAAAASTDPATGDLDSLPGNGVATEDDQAAATIAVTAVAGPVPRSEPSPGPTPSSGSTSRCAVTLRGNRRNNTVRGSTGSERILGLQGGDRLLGRGGSDCLFGGAGDDRLDGGAGDDQVDGGSGNDTLVGGSGRDALSGGTGRDLIRARDGVRETLRCGAGRDIAIVDRSDRVLGCEVVRRG